jgi:hypothetical protein
MSNGTSSVPESEVYRTLGSFVMHSEQIRWTRLNTFIVMSSIFAAVWAAVFTTTGYFCGKCWLLALFCFPGIVMGIIWPFLGWRGSTYLDDFHGLACGMEQNFPQGVPRPFHASEERRQRCMKLTSSKFLVTAIPVMFLVVFVALAVTSFILVKKT